MRPNSGEFWSHLFTAQGRNDRTQFWIVFVLCWMAEAVAGALTTAAGGNTLAEATSLLLIFGSMGVGVLNMIKRLHDLGRSGWWLLAVTILFAPLAAMGESVWTSDQTSIVAILAYGLVSLALLLLLGLLPGQQAPNRFDEVHPWWRPRPAVAASDEELLGEDDL
jgi:uncharacterized membrane protein YhaH (DUF805 family)